MNTCYLYHYTSVIYIAVYNAFKVLSVLCYKDFCCKDFPSLIKETSHDIIVNDYAKFFP